MNEKIRERTYQWDDPLEGATKAKSITGFDYLQAMNNGEIPLPPVLHTLDFGKPELEEGKVTFTFEPQEFHYNPIGSVHGGVISTILDSAMGCTLQSILPAGTGYTTLELKVNFLKAVSYQSGVMKATGKIIHSGGRTALVEASLTDEKGKIYAHAVSTCLIVKF